MEKELLDKYEKLKEILRELGKVAVAYSSGVDSTFLLKVAKDVLGENAVAITAHSNSFSKQEFEESIAFCENENIKHHILETNELEIAGFKENPIDRCYICKSSLFSNMKKIAKEEYDAVLVEGSNMDDEGDYRPGMKAIAELMIASPLREVGLYKEEIRILSKELKLDTWDKPSFACLATRIPYGEEITLEKLEMIEKAESLLFDLGMKQARVRCHGDMARIEVEVQDFPKILLDKNRMGIVNRFREFGFAYVSMDLCGYKTGNMNKKLTL